MDIPQPPADRRLWACPMCKQQYFIPMALDDPMACEQCAPPKKKAEPPRHVGIEPKSVELNVASPPKLNKQNLTICKDCNNQISKSATACPHCGSPLKKEVNTRDTYAGCLTICVILFAGFFYLVSGDSEKEINQSNDSLYQRNTDYSPNQKPTEWSGDVMTRALAKEIIPTVMRNPETVEFPSIFEGGTKVTEKDGGYYIDSWVISKNDFGVEKKTYYRLWANGEGNNTTVNRIDLKTENVWETVYND
ncbi:hypothetical protein Pla110_10020 [Polystyrenella longa]|uniref:Uncharacterized protein n=1 Tax=Polystyrenella longa TaxID=2528007 RepID=A0A518CJD1_9PLAN|nr:zinc-ribbon domain-containing protein [Polystyrenella longa]QDU79294.1 hypothetical protein Pla110_10020 [Polystyrenella longa]